MSEYIRFAHESSGIDGLDSAKTAWNNYVRSFITNEKEVPSLDDDINATYLHELSRKLYYFNFECLLADTPTDTDVATYVYLVSAIAIHDNLDNFSGINFRKLYEVSSKSSSISELIRSNVEIACGNREEYSFITSVTPDELFWSNFYLNRKQVIIHLYSLYQTHHDLYLENMFVSRYIYRPDVLESISSIGSGLYHFHETIVNITEPLQFINNIYKNETSSRVYLISIVCTMYNNKSLKTFTDDSKQIKFENNFKSFAELLKSKYPEDFNNLETLHNMGIKPKIFELLQLSQNDSEELETPEF